MKLRNYKLLLIFCVACTGMFRPAFSQTISQVEYIGLKRTRPQFIASYTQVRAGQSLDSILLNRDVLNLMNQKHFESVDYTISASDSNNQQVKVVFHFKENYSLLPNIDVGITKDIYRIQLGIVDFHSLGRGGAMNLYVRQFGRTSVYFTGDYPHILGKKRGLMFNFIKSSTFEPIPENQQRTDFNYDLWTASLFYRKDPNIYNTLKIGGGYQFEQYTRRYMDTLESLNQMKQTNRIMLRSIYKFYDINYRKEIVDGYSAELTIDGAIPFNQHPGQASYSGSEPMVKALLEMKWFWVPYANGNTAVRLRLGASKAGIYDRFMIDDNVNIRGAGYRKTRSSTELVTNVEHRQTFYRHKYATLQMIGFADFNPEMMYVGAGGRMYISRFHNIVARADYGFNVRNYRQGGIVAGIHHYF